MKKREIEIKLVVLANMASFAQLRFMMSSIFKTTELTSYSSGTYADQYWKAPASDFVRLRVGREPQLTTKKTDRQDIADRAEVEVNLTNDQIDGLADVLTTMLGSEGGTILWTFCDWEVGTHAGTVTVSLMHNHEDRQNYFIEVEGDDAVTVAEMVSRVKGNLAQEHGINVEKVKNSFFDIYVNRQGVKV